MYVFLSMYSNLNWRLWSLKELYALNTMHFDCNMVFHCAWISFYNLHPWELWYEQIKGSILSLYCTQNFTYTGVHSFIWCTIFFITLKPCRYKPKSLFSTPPLVMIWFCHHFTETSRLLHTIIILHPKLYIGNMRVNH